MTTLSKQGDELMMLAVTTEAHLLEQGYEVTAKPNAEVTAFEIRGAEDDELLCRVQAVGAESFEIVRLNGETLTGVGDQRVMHAMLARIIADLQRRAA